jgi:hypothetical protein
MSRRNTLERASNAEPIDGVNEILRQMWGTGPYPDEPRPTLPTAPRPGADQHSGQPAGEGGGGMLELLAGLNVTLGAVNSQLAAMSPRSNWRRRPSIPLEYCHPLDLAPDQSTGAGLIDKPDKWGPKTGWIWHITRLTVVGGAGTTTITAYKDSSADPSMQANSITGTAPVTLQWEPRLLLLLPNRKLVFSSVGGGVTVNGEGVEIAVPWIAEYLL